MPSDPAEDLCTLFFYDTERALYYPTIAIPVVNATRDKPLYYDYLNPNGIEYHYSEGVTHTIAKKGSSKVGIIVGAVLGGFAGLAIVALGVFFWEWRKRKAKKLRKNVELELQDRNENAPPAYTPAISAL